MNLMEKIIGEIEMETTGLQVYKKKMGS